MKTTIKVIRTIIKVLVLSQPIPILAGLAKKSHGQSFLCGYIDGLIADLFIILSIFVMAVIVWAFFGDED